MNSVILIGRLTADPELRFFNTGVAISKITLAINRSYRKDSQVVTDFIPVEIWGKKAEYCATYIEKGCLVAISGSLHIDRFIDSTGNNRNYAKVVANSIMKLNTPNKNNGGNEINSSETAVTNSGGDITDSETTVANTNIGGTDSEIGNQSNSQSTSSDITNNKTSSSTNSSTTSNNPTNNSELSDDPTSNLTACTEDDLPF